MAFPKNVQISIHDEVSVASADPASVSINLSLDALYMPSLERYGVANLRLWVEGQASEITGTLMRALPIHEYLCSGISQLGFYSIPESKVTQSTALTWLPENVEAITARGPGMDELKQIVQLYRIAEVLNHRPAKHVADMLKSPYPTASKWIARAKSAGAFPLRSHISEEQLLLGKSDARELRFVHEIKGE